MIKQFYNKIFNNKFSKDSLWILLSQLFLAINGILINIFISNFYSSNLLGVFNQALSFFLIFAAISNLGIFNATVKHVSEINSGKIDMFKVLSANVKIVLVSSLICFTVVKVILNFKFSIFSSANLENAIETILIAIPGFAINRIFMGYFNAIRDMRVYSLIRFLRWAGYIAVFIIFSLITEDFFKSLLAFSITEYIILLFCFFKFKRIFVLKTNLSQIKKSISFGSKSFLSEIISDSQDRLDIIIIGYLLSATDVGYYSFAASIAKGVLLIPSVFMQNINPIVSKLWAEKNLLEIDTYIRKLKKISFKIMLPFILLTFCFYLILIHFFMPIEFKSTILIFSIMLISSFLLSLISWSGGFLLMAEKLYSNLFRVIILLILSVLLNLVFIYFLGLTGASIAYFIYVVFVILVTEIFLRKIMCLSLFKRLE